MKNLVFLCAFFTIVSLSSCGSAVTSTSNSNTPTPVELQDSLFFKSEYETLNEVREHVIWNELATYPFIKDSTTLINKLRKYFFVPDEAFVKYRILQFNRRAILGTSDSLYILDLAQEPAAPMRFYFSADYHYIDKENFSKRIWQPIALNTKDSTSIKPILFAYESNHQEDRWTIYRYSPDSKSFINMLDEYTPKRPLLIDSLADGQRNVPAVFMPHFADLNNDNYTDIFFKGEVQFYKNARPTKLIPVRYVYLYDRKKEVFMQQENYEKKYHLVDFIDDEIE